jgi:N12 class adenine-specific DNA methylase
MTKTDLKIKINQAIENAPESVLQAVLDYLNQIHEDSSDKLTLSQNFGKILREDRELLQRLAL